MHNFRVHLSRSLFALSLTAPALGVAQDAKDVGESPAVLGEAAETTVASSPTVEPVAASDELPDALPESASSSTSVDEASEAEAIALAPTARERVDRVLRPLPVGSDSVTVGAYIRAAFDATVNTEPNMADYEGFALRNARIFTDAKYDVSENFGVSARIEFDFRQGTPAATDAYVSLRFLNDRLQLHVGQTKTAFSLSQTFSETRRQFAPDRENVISPEMLRGWRDRGVRLDVEAPVGKGVLTWRTSFGNGDGMNDIRNEDSRFLYSTFVDYAPLGKMSFEESDLRNSSLLFAVGGSAWYTPSIANSEFGNVGANTSEIRYSAHGRLRYRGLSVHGEYMGVHVEETIPGQQILRRGWSAQAGYVLPTPGWPQIELLGRFSQTDLDSVRTGFEGTIPDFTVAKTRQIEAGANLFLVDHRVKFQLLYRHTDLLEGPERSVTGDRFFGDTVTLSLQVGAF